MKYKELKHKASKYEGSFIGFKSKDIVEIILTILSQIFLGFVFFALIDNKIILNSLLMLNVIICTVSWLPSYISIKKERESLLHALNPSENIVLTKEMEKGVLHQIISMNEFVSEIYFDKNKNTFEISNDPINKKTKEHQYVTNKMLEYFKEKHN